jgi:hypothetical protein
MGSQFPKFRDSRKIAGKNGKGINRKKQNGEADRQTLWRIQPLDR